MRSAHVPSLVLEFAEALAGAAGVDDDDDDDVDVDLGGDVEVENADAGSSGPSLAPFANLLVPQPATLTRTSKVTIEAAMPRRSPRSSNPVDTDATRRR